MFYYMLRCLCVYGDTRKRRIGEFVECEFTLTCRSNGGTQRVVEDYSSYVTRG